MYLVPVVKQVITRFSNKFPLPKSDEIASQDWTHKLCQQLKFSFPTDGWGHKSAGVGRPHSKDVIALESPFIGWDVILAAGTSTPELSLTGDSIDLTGQLFETVIAFDFLDSTPPPPPIPGTIDEKLNQILTNQTIILNTMESYHDEEIIAITKPRTCQ